MREAAVDQSRRQALKALGSTSALGLSGCCGLAQRQLPDASFPGLRSEVRPFLMRPEQTKVRSSAMPCLDVHAHFFNAKDVPVRAFLQKSVGHDQSSVVQFLLSLMAPAIEAVAQDLAPSAAEEWRDLQEKGSRFAKMTPNEITAQLDLEAYVRAADVGKALYEETRRRTPEAIALFNSLALEAEPGGKRSGIGIDAFSEEMVIRVIRESHEPTELRALDDGVNAQGRRTRKS